MLRKALPIIKNANFGNSLVTKRFASLSTEDVMKREHKYSANNYHPLPVAIARGKGVFVWDMEGTRYWDFLSGYAATNHGHCHPKLVSVMIDQIRTMHHTSRAFYNDILGEFGEIVCNMFSYDKMLPMNTGVEGCETSCKIARKWGYAVKKIPPNQAKIVFAEGNFWGRSLAAVSASTDPTSFQGYEPLMPGFEVVPFDDLAALERSFQDRNVCAFMVEPIQGEAGVRVPTYGYLQGVRDLCSQYNVLWIADEVQTGLGRTGRMLCIDYEEVQPDILVLGKSLAGALYPVSVVLANNPIMDVIKPGTHGSTFGGNPLGMRMAIEGIKILEEENLPKNADLMGIVLRGRLNSMVGKVIKSVRGKGLMNAIEINTEVINAWDFCLKLIKAGILTKMTHDSIIRMSPPLVITKGEMHRAMDAMEKAIKDI